jgi:hypothetical protein
MTKAKFPRTKTDGYFVVFGDEHWAAMEANTVYGRKLPKKVRDLISLATLLLTLRWPGEQSAPPLGGATAKKIKQLTALADQLRSELFSAHMWLPNYQPHYRHRTALANLQLQLAEVQEGDDFSLLRVCLSSIIETGNIIDQKISNEPFGQRLGRAWSLWVVLMTIIMNSHNLPSGVRARSSPFVRLIRYLQDHALQGNKPTHSEEALSKSIQRARESIIISFDVNPKEVEGFICRLLGIAEATTVLPSNPSDMECMVAWVLGEEAAGIYPLVPGPFFYSDEDPEPITRGPQPAPESKPRGPKHR